MAAPRCVTINKEESEIQERLDKKLKDYEFSRMPLLKKAHTAANEITRSALTSIDFMFGRQGLLPSAMHPILGAQGMVKSFKAFFSEAAAKEQAAEVRSRENHKNGLDARAELALDKNSEAFAHRLIDSWLEKAANLPVVGKPAALVKAIIQGSDRAYRAFGEHMQAGMFDSLVGNAAREGRISDAEAKFYANGVNVFTGVGNTATYGKTMKSWLDNANIIAFAPKWVLSRLQVLTGQPLLHGVTEGGVPLQARGKIALEYAKAGAMFATVVAMASAAGLKTQLDPRSSDFGKIIVGDTRVDISGGLSNMATFLSRMGTGTTINAQGQRQPVYGSSGRAPQIIGRFVTSKLAPLPGGAVNAISAFHSGEDMFGHRIGPAGVAGQLVQPLFVRDVIDAMGNLGVPRGTAVSLAGLLGFGLNTYQHGQPRARRGY